MSIERRRAIGALTLVAAVGVAVVVFRSNTDEGSDPGSVGAGDVGDGGIPTTPDAERWSSADAVYVGSVRCGECHEDERAAHLGSDHDRAIEEPTRETVLAPFAGERFEQEDFVATFTHDGSADDGFVVRTEGSDGRLADFPVAYTFGFRPLQQYLLDVGDGRLQALSVAWDARPAEEGGQRHFSLYPLERIEADDPLHWTRAMQNWNYVCADCHSTAFEKGYDEDSGVFEPRWAELDVGCEACHGPGSAHVAWAEAGAEGAVGGLVVDLPRAGWLIPPGEATATPQPGAQNRPEIETCAPCHSRRSQLAEGRRPDEPLLDYYLPELLARRLYHHDGQIDGEVYVYGSFLQSRMFHAGVRCSDCHDPHSLGLRREGNALCTGCHAEAVFDAAEHHHHPDGAGSACVACHMPQKTYMEVDPRRDHSLRIPRPDLNESIGVPDACTGCHEDRGSAWAAARVVEWYGAERPAHFGTTLHAARRREPRAAAAIRALVEDESVPAIARGTALVLLQDFPGEDANVALLYGARSDEPLVRLGAAYGVRELPPAARYALVSSLLGDPLRAVRTEAARSLALVPGEALRPADAQALEAAIEDLIAAERFNSDRAESWLRIGQIELDRGRIDASEAALQTSLRRDRRFTPALVNLADIKRQRGHDDEAEALLRRALTIQPADAEAMHALGLTLVRLGRAEEATDLLGRAADLRADNPRFRYVHAVALAERGERAAAITALELGLDAHPRDPEMLSALMTYRMEAGDTEGARALARVLLEANPNDARLRAFVDGQ